MTPEEEELWTNAVVQNLGIPLVVIDRIRERVGYSLRMAELHGTVCERERCRAICHEHQKYVVYGSNAWNALGAAADDIAGA